MELRNDKSVAIGVSVDGAAPLFSMLIATVDGLLFGAHWARWILTATNFIERAAVRQSYLLKVA
jgi:hypothetical protein